MFLSVRHKPTQREARSYAVFNKDTGEKIPHVIWANDETGRYRQFLIDENGRHIIKNDRAISKIFTGNIELRRVA